jgi:hypothetical protein
MVEVTFYVVLKTELLPVTISDDARIFKTFQYLKSESRVARRILGRTLFDQYEYYKLKNPVALPCGVYNCDEIVKTCLCRDNWEQVSPNYTLDVLAPTLSGNHVHMAIRPKGELPAYLPITDQPIHSLR